MRKALIFVAMLSSVALFLVNREALYVAAPLYFCLFIMAWLTYALWEKDGGLPLFDIGFICALVTFVYIAIPLLNYLVGGLRFGPLSDARLQLYNPSPSDIGLFHLRHVVYFASLASAYVFFRRKVYLSGGVEYPNSPLTHLLIILFCALWVYFQLLRLLTGFSFNASYGSDEYWAILGLVSSLPLIVIQISVKLYGVYFLIKLAVLFIIIQKCRTRRWRTVLWIWILYELFYTFQLRGARSELVFFLLGAVLMYHRLIRPLSLRFVLPVGGLFFALFIFMGVYRGSSNITEAIAVIQGPRGGILVRGDEFQSLLGTAYDVYLRTRGEGVKLPWYLYINDIITVLPPQQLLPFEKVRASEWYLQLIGLSGQGQGYMWGVITQSIIGLGWIELILRGSILGFILAKVHHWYGSRKESFLVNIIYIYLCLRVYYTFRDTTGAILSFVVWEIIPFLIILKIGRALMPHSGRYTSDVRI